MHIYIYIYIIYIYIYIYIYCISSTVEESVSTGSINRFRQHLYFIILYGGSVSHMLFRTSYNMDQEVKLWPIPLSPSDSRCLPVSYQVRDATRNFLVHFGSASLHIDRSIDYILRAHVAQIQSTAQQPWFTSNYDSNERQANAKGASWEKVHTRYTDCQSVWQ